MGPKEMDTTERLTHTHSTVAVQCLPCLPGLLQPHLMYAHTEGSDPSGIHYLLCKYVLILRDLSKLIWGHMCVSPSVASRWNRAFVLTVMLELEGLITYRRRGFMLSRM